MNVASSDGQIDKPQRGRPKRAELPDVNINTGAQSINTERASIKDWFGRKRHRALKRNERLGYVSFADSSFQNCQCLHCYM